MRAWTSFIVGSRALALRHLQPLAEGVLTGLVCVTQGILVGVAGFGWGRLPAGPVVVPPGAPMADAAKMDR